MKQTAVEWLVTHINLGLTYEQEVIFEGLFERAKGMEKEQMRYFIQVGYYAHSQGHTKDDELYNYWIDNYNRE
jgi:hypothetical protein